MKNLVKMPFFRLALLVLVVVILGLLLKKYVANRERFFNPQNCPYDVDSFIGKTQTIITLNIKETSDTANKQIDFIVEESDNRLTLQYRIYDENTANEDKGDFINIESLEYKTKQNTDGNTEIESIKVNDISIKIYKRTLNDGGNSCIDSYDNIVTTIEDSDESKSINKLFTYLVDFLTLTNDTYEETQLKKFKLYDPEKKTDGTDEDHVSFSIIVKKKNGTSFEDKLSKLTFVNKLENLSGYTNVYAVNPTFSIHVLDIGSPLVFGTTSNTPPNTTSTTKGDVTKTDNTSTNLSKDSDSIITFKDEQYKHLTEYGTIIDYINNIKLQHTNIDPQQIRAASEICKRCYQTNSGCLYQTKHQPSGTSQTVTTNMGCTFENAADPVIFRCNVCGDITDSLDNKKATIFTIADKNDSDTKKNFLSTMPYASPDDIKKLLTFIFKSPDPEITYNNLNLSNTLSVIGGNTNQGGSGTSSGSGSTSGSANNSPFYRSLENLKEIMNQKLGEPSPTISNNEVNSSINAVNKLEELLVDSEIQQVNTFRNFSYSGGISSPAPFDTTFSPTTGNSSVSEFSRYKNYL